jgi:hypothetical protein
MQVPTEFPSFAMAALAGIGALPDTIEDRSVIIHMRRRKPTETVKPFRMRRDRPAIELLGARLGTWLSSPDVRAMMDTAEPVSDLEDRQADVWESLFLVADVAGGEWPARARTAAKRLCDEVAADEGDVSPAVQLLHDLAEVFELIQGEFVPTEVLLQHLRSVDESPWAELNGHRLGAMLRDFGIRSTRDSTGSKRGYRRSSFTDPWERYPRVQAGQPSEPSESVSTDTDQQEWSDVWTDAS